MDSIGIRGRRFAVELTTKGLFCCHCEDGDVNMKLLQDNTMRTNIVSHIWTSWLRKPGSQSRQHIHTLERHRTALCLAAAVVLVY